MTNGAIRILARRDVVAILEQDPVRARGVIEQAYLDYGAGEAVNPHSLFLLPPAPPVGRIIALPAGLFGAQRAMGMKWISSFPENIQNDLDRASAVIVLNDTATGFPSAMMEGAVISAWRTALSASLACAALAPERGMADIALIGCGLIAARTLRALRDDGWTPESIHLFDTDTGRARDLAERLAGNGTRSVVHASAEDAARAAGIIVFATTAASPWFTDAAALAHNPIVLHLSLRDLSPELILASQNIVDDVDHATRAATSVDLAARRLGDVKFIDGEMAALLGGDVRRRPDVPAIFSPFGLGVLDIALADHVLRLAASADMGLLLEDFFS